MKDEKIIKKKSKKKVIKKEEPKKEAKKPLFKVEGSLLLDGKEYKKGDEVEIKDEKISSKLKQIGVIS